MKSSVCIKFSGLTLKFSFPSKVNLPDFFSDLLCEDTDSPHAEYQIELLSSPLCPEGYAVLERKDFSVYRTKDGWLRIYTPLTAKDGCCVACLIRENGRHTIYYPASMWDHYKSYFHCTHLMCGELMLLSQNALLLHSSVVMINDKTILFCGASGAGKSTQADLWEKHMNAEILNGDRALIMKKGTKFYAGGSIWCGTSGIYRSEQKEIAGIIVLKKHSETLIRPLTSEAFPMLFSQTTINDWDQEFVNRICTIYTDLLASVPVYELSCRADKEAVDFVYNTLFKKEDI